jgi:hypothetical protein
LSGASHLFSSLFLDRGRGDRREKREGERIEEREESERASLLEALILSNYLCIKRRISALSLSCASIINSNLVYRKS